ncbi:hypothetical protein CDD83_8412 [Cordyceps sp. RAO-2017]|nr:hypothetical protein CDD83_8412 [Cordyceps sp. RAO-2017]
MLIGTQPGQFSAGWGIWGRWQLLLDDYSKVRPYMETSTRGVSMASSKKSFLQTQYKRYRMKIDWGSIDLPLGLSFEYYDLDSKVWIRNVTQEPVSFQHLCGLQVPKALLNAGVENPTKVSWTDGLTSYEIVASQTRCPSEISTHEFSAFQRLLTGKPRRWMTPSPLQRCVPGRTTWSSGLEKRRRSGYRTTAMTIITQKMPTPQ